jgi:apolipoprotein D and lipocalin family protein
MVCVESLCPRGGLPVAHKFALILLGVVMGIAPGLAEGTPGKAMPGSEREPLKTVSSVDINRYMGTWYEIARMPNRFEKKCKDDVTAHYELNPDGKVSVRNECRMSDGGTNTAHGRAHVVDGSGNSKLRVTFFWPFYADYWIIDLDKDYRYAVVGEPERKYLWILSRTPQVGADTYQHILKTIEEHGYDVSKIVKTEQSAVPAANITSK